MQGLSASGIVSILVAIVTLVILEGLLSADNALVMAVMVRHLPPREQIRVLRYGVIGAIVFRMIAVLGSSFLLDYWIFKVLGGGYLLFLAFSNLIKIARGENREDTGKHTGARGFWATVIAVEFADIAFSIDSIVAAVALAEGLPDDLERIRVIISIKLWVVYIGGVLGIVMMRMVTRVFIRILDRFEGLESGAYYLVAWIGVKLVGSGFHNALHPEKHAPPAWTLRLPSWMHSIPLEMSDLLFWAGMGVILIASLLYRSKRPDPQAPTADSGAGSS